MAEIESIQVTLKDDPARPQYLAKASLVVAGLCVRWIQLIRTRSGGIRVVFPDEPVRVRCRHCTYQIPVTHKYCHGCGTLQPWREVELNRHGVPHKYLSVVFPISTAIRDEYEAAILGAYSVALSEAELATHAKAS